MSPWNTVIIYSVTQYTFCIQVTDKILAKRSNVHIEHVELCRGRDSFLKWVKDMIRKERARSQRGRHLCNYSSGLPHPETGFMRTHGKGPELLEPIRYESVAECTKGFVLLILVVTFGNNGKHVTEII